MASIDYGVGDAGFDTYQEEGVEEEELSIDETLSLDRIRRYSRSDLVLHRLHIAKDIIEAIRQLNDSDREGVLSVIHDLHTDPEAIIRKTLVMNMAGIAKYYGVELGEVSVVRERIIPILNIFLQDVSEEVRMATHNAWIESLRLLERSEVKNVAVPMLTKLAHDQLEEDFRIEALQLIAQTASLLEVTVVQEDFPAIFTELAGDSSLRVRKACVSNLPDVCRVVGPEKAASDFLPLYLGLVHDEIWGVRKACAEALMAISQCVDPVVREEKLTEVFEKLAEDQSRWVRSAAYQYLGSFVSTFGQPDAVQTYEEWRKKWRAHVMAVTEAQDQGITSARGTPAKPVTGEGSDVSPVATEYSLNYWKTPVPALPEDDGKETGATSAADSMEVDNGNAPPTDGDKGYASADDSVTQSAGGNSEDPDSRATGDAPQDKSLVEDEGAGRGNVQKASVGNDLDPTIVAPPLDIGHVHRVPQRLLDRYAGVINLHGRQADSDAAYNCAYNLPAVIMTMGPSSWEFLGSIYITLARDHMQWKVRRTLACSIHDVAAILGTEIAERDLIPVFNTFIKDLDEVKVGAINHMAEFLEMLTPEKRQEYLPTLKELQEGENRHNWRFRKMLSEQLIQLHGLFTAQDVLTYIAPVAFHMANDSVHCVRRVANQALGLIYTKLLRCSQATGNTEQANEFSRRILDQFASGQSYKDRQNYLNIAAELIPHAQPEHFIQHHLKHVLKLASDPVINVRITSGRVLREVVMNTDYLANRAEELGINAALKKLRDDEDIDVAQMAGSTRSERIVRRSVCENNPDRSKSEAAAARVEQELGSNPHSPAAVSPSAPSGEIVMDSSVVSAENPSNLIAERGQLEEGIAEEGHDTSGSDDDDLEDDSMSPGPPQAPVADSSTAMDIASPAAPPQETIASTSEDDENEKQINGLIS
eukprot:Clim_evm19s15 gene=Clim_evmTU19s15